jgi:hypothetical protein
MNSGEDPITYALRPVSNLTARHAGRSVLRTAMVSYDLAKVTTSKAGHHGLSLVDRISTNSSR